MSAIFQSSLLRQLCSHHRPGVPDCTVLEEYDPISLAPRFSEVYSAEQKGETVSTVSQRPGPSVVIVVAHADDEAIGAGAQLARWNVQNVIYVTDGAPRNAGDAVTHGFDSVATYAAARRREAEAAL